MARSCTVCTHPDRNAIDQAIVSREPAPRIARRYALSHDAVTRHGTAHISKSVIAVHKRREELDALTLLDRVEELTERVSAMLDKVEASGQAKNFFSGIKEYRALLELAGRLTGELDSRPQVQVLNVTTSPEWLAVRAALLQALASYPEAKAAVTGALLELEARKEGAS